MTYDKQTLIMNHMELAKDIAKREWRTAPHALQKDELISNALLGLVDAADRWEAYCAKNQYDPAATQYFKVFAGLRIRGTIRDQIRKDDWATRTLRTKSKKLRDAGQDEGLSIEQLAEKTEMTVAEIHKVNTRLAQRPISLESYMANDTHTDKPSSSGGNELRDDVDTEGTAFANTMQHIFISTLKELPEDELLIIVMHYYKKLDLKHIAEELCLPEARVSQLHVGAIMTVRDAMTNAAIERG
jgi:RNA polymerase sigma factor FliA